VTQLLKALRKFATELGKGAGRRGVVAVIPILRHGGSPGLVVDGHEIAHGACDDRERLGLALHGLRIVAQGGEAIFHLVHLLLRRLPEAGDDAPSPGMARPLAARSGGWCMESIGVHSASPTKNRAVLFGIRGEARRTIRPDDFRAEREMPPRCGNGPEDNHEKLFEKPPVPRRLGRPGHNSGA
jgi:hypothetical protein